MFSAFSSCCRFLSPLCIEAHNFDCHIDTSQKCYELLLAFGGCHWNVLVVVVVVRYTCIGRPSSYSNPESDNPSAACLLLAFLNSRQSSLPITDLFLSDLEKNDLWVKAQSLSNNGLSGKDGAGMSRALEDWFITSNQF